MKIDSVDFFYLSMPEVLDVGDGSQDALMVRLRADDLEGCGGGNAKPRPCLRSRRGCARVRTRPANPCEIRCWGNASTVSPISRESEIWCEKTVSICYKPSTRCRVLILRCGIC